jgi:hypothetical protein
VSYKSNLPAVKAEMHRRIEGALIAGANVLRTAVMLGLRGGYKSGAFVTGKVMNSVTIGPVEWQGNSATIRVGSNVKYALYWEVGHKNIFTRKFERKEVWRPAMEQSAPRIREVIGKFIGGGTVTLSLDTPTLDAAD